MSNPVIHAFFVGRAFAEVLNDKVEDVFSNALSELGKFDAQQRENMREFAQEVMARAEQQAANGNQSYPSSRENFTANGSRSTDLQETIDELRAEIARLRAELKLYKSSVA